jgi:hypothetical protein
MYHHKKHFSLSEARTTLEGIRSDIERMVALKRELDDLGYDMYRHTFFGGIGPNGEGFHPPQLEELVVIIQSIVERGIQIKGIDNGLIDFPHIRENGEEVYLCWKVDESGIEYWHPIPDGFKGRRHISEL